MSTVNDSELLPLALTELREKLCAGGPGRTGLSAPGLRNSHKTTSCVATYECCSLEVETETREWYFINTFTVCVCVCIWIYIESIHMVALLALAIQTMVEYKVPKTATHILSFVNFIFRPSVSH